MIRYRIAQYTGANTARDQGGCHDDEQGDCAGDDPNTGEARGIDCGFSQRELAAKAGMVSVVKTTSCKAVIVFCASHDHSA